jgi:hypothetical protein|tara:strand:- start:1240 stop:1545 length:306 start_codon:yes stop_codon:yes gene_type:complete
MSIKKTFKFKTESITLPPTSSAHPESPITLPIAGKPGDDVDLEAALNRLGDTIKGLLKNMDKLKQNLDNLTAENQKLKDALGIYESPLVLTEDMEVKDGHQ